MTFDNSGSRNNLKSVAMNRRERRALASAMRARNKADQKPVAIHEAGHAVAKVLASAELGYDINEVIAYIDIGVGGSSISSDGKMLLSSQAVTFGPTFSREISAIAGDILQLYLGARTKPPSSEGDTLEGPDSHEFRSKLFEAAGNAGVDFDRWFRARTFDAVAGSIAEAIISNQPFVDLFWKGYAAESDRRSIVADANVFGLPIDKALATANRMAVLAAYLMEEPCVWNAVCTLARKLPVAGRMQGAKAAALIAKALSSSDATELFAAGLQAVEKFEKEIGMAKVVFGIYPDGSKHLIKGIASLDGSTQAIKGIASQGGSKHLITGIANLDLSGGAALGYRCRLPVLEETLWLAFGDGSASWPGSNRPQGRF